MRVIDEKTYLGAKKRKKLDEELDILQRKKESIRPAVISQPVADLTPVTYGVERVAERTGEIGSVLQQLIQVLSTNSPPPVTVQLNEVKKNFKITITERDRDGLIKTAKIEEA